MTKRTKKRSAVRPAPATPIDWKVKYTPPTKQWLIEYDGRISLVMAPDHMAALKEFAARHNPQKPGAVMIAPVGEVHRCELISDTTLTPKDVTGGS